MILTLEIPDVELFDARTQTFINVPGGVFRFEHSLWTISKWEYKWHVSYLYSLQNKTITPEQEIDYFLCMCLDDGLQEEHLTNNVLKQLYEYIQNPASATVIKSNQNGGNNKITTSETLYGLMTMSAIPFECEHWHLNRLLMLLQVVADYHSPKKKMTREEVLSQNAKLNAERKAKYNTKG